MSGSFDVLTDEERDSLTRCRPPDAVSPMLATLTDAPFSNADWVFERKLDGERVIAYRHGDGARLASRNDKPLSASYPELVDALEAQACRDFIADGEVVAFEGDVTSFQKLQGRMQIEDPEEARASRVAVYYYLFDLIYLDGYKLDQLPLRARKKVLKRAFAFTRPLRYMAHRNADGEAFFTQACEKGWEGLIAKRADAPYRHQRSRDWLKFKCAHGQELVIGGFTEPRGSRTGFGALLVGYYEQDALRYAGKVGTGYGDEFLAWFRKRLESLERKTSPFAEDVHERDVHWVTPKLVGEFGFTEWTEDGKLRHPRFLGLRRDKDAGDVVRERPAR